MRLTSASSADLRATIALMPSTARPTAPISSLRRASGISASISPPAMRCRTLTRRPSGRVMPMREIRTAQKSPAARPNALNPIWAQRAALVFSVRVSETFCA